MQLPRAVVCLPTYNERENLEPMLRALGDKDVHVLVIDDNSPDGTGELADRLAAELDYVDVLHRERKEGLGPAYLAGFRRALSGDAELVLEMDCDFSHDPNDVPRLIAAVADGADVVLGSRYVPGGGVRNWGAAAPSHLRGRIALRPRRARRPGSRSDRRVQMLPALRPRDDRPRRDPLEGLRVPDRDDLPGAARRLRVVEMPITFADREVGGSKMSKGIVAEAIWKVPRLRLAALLGRL